MEKINGLEIEVSRFVELNNIEVPDNIYKGLIKLNEAGVWIDYGDEESMEALQWIEDNIDKLEKVKSDEEYQVKDMY